MDGKSYTSSADSPASVIRLGFYSPSQNGIVISPKGIAHCLCGGGKGHDTDKPKILLAFR